MSDNEVLVSLLAVLVSRGGSVRVPLQVFTDMDGKQYDIMTKFDRSTKEIIFTAFTNQQIN